MSTWEGFCRQALEGAIYAKQIREATLADRITAVTYSPNFPVSVFADLGWADHTSLWFIQKVGFEYRIIRSYQNRLEPWQHYMQYMQQLGYLYDTIYLPHDARAKELGTGKSVEEITKKMGYTVRVVPMLSVEDGINAARSIFSQCFFDEKLCADGLQALRRYRYEVDQDDNSWGRKPLHDDSSHFADAFRYFAVGTRDIPKKEGYNLPEKRKITLYQGNSMNTGWMRK
jgi:phage terminase large subunit